MDLWILDTQLVNIQVPRIGILKSTLLSEDQDLLHHKNTNGYNYFSLNKRVYSLESGEPK